MRSRHPTAAGYDPTLWRARAHVLLCVLISLVGCAQEAVRGGDCHFLRDLARTPFARSPPTGSVLAQYQWQQPAAHWRLPRELKEVSGAAHLGPERLLTHDDNESTLWTLTGGSAGKAPELALLGGQRGGPAHPLDGDFEGVTVLGGNVYLLGSQGTLHRAPMDAHATTLTGALEAVPTGVEGRCNFEGVAADPLTGSLYLVCKYPRDPVPGTILLFRLKPGSGEPPQTLQADVSAVLEQARLERLRPSGLVWLPESSRLLVLAGKERVMLELDERGSLLAWRRLSRRYHRQAEGLSVSPGGVIVIADEADGRTATLSLYR